MKIVALIPKKAGMTDKDFRTYYETNHVPLITTLLPYYSEYHRNYVISDLGEPNEASSAKATDNPRARFNVITEISYATKEDFDRTMAAMADPDVAGRIAADEEKFIDRDNVLMYLVDNIQGGPGQA